MTDAQLDFDDPRWDEDQAALEEFDSEEDADA